MRQSDLLNLRYECIIELNLGPSIPIQPLPLLPSFLPSSPPPPHHPPNPATNNISIFETGFAVNIPYGTILIWTSMSDSKFSLRGLCTVCVSIKYAQNKFSWRKVMHRRNAAADFSWPVWKFYVHSFGLVLQWFSPVCNGIPMVHWWNAI